jgi:hypothetical protein
LVTLLKTILYLLHSEENFTDEYSPKFPACKVRIYLKSKPHPTAKVWLLSHLTKPPFYQKACNYHVSIDCANGYLVIL